MPADRYFHGELVILVHGQDIEPTSPSDYRLTHFQLPVEKPQHGGMSCAAKYQPTRVVHHVDRERSTGLVKTATEPAHMARTWRTQRAYHGAALHLGLQVAICARAVASACFEGLSPRICACVVYQS